MSNFESIMVYVETLNEKPIPYNNEFYLSSSIREILSNTPFFYDDDIHGDNEWTKYTMSRIFPLDDDKEFNEDGIYTDDYSFIFRSLDKNISRVLKGSLGINPTLRLDDSKGKVKEISSIDDPNFDEMTNFKSRSPVLIRTPSSFDTDKRYLEPVDSSFEEVLANHIVETYKEYTEERTNVDVNVKIDEYDKPVKIYRCYNCGYINTAENFEKISKNKNKCLQCGQIFNINKESVDYMNSKLVYKLKMKNIFNGWLFNSIERG